MTQKESSSADNRIPSLPKGIENILAREKRIQDIASDIRLRAIKLMEDFGAPEGELRRGVDGEVERWIYFKTPPINVRANDGVVYQVWLTQQVWDEDEDRPTVVPNSISVKAKRRDDITCGWNSETIVRSCYEIVGDSISDRDRRKITDVKEAEEAETVIAELERIMAEKLKKNDRTMFIYLYPQRIDFYPVQSH